MVEPLLFTSYNSLYILQPLPLSIHSAYMLQPLLLSLYIAKEDALNEAGLQKRGDR